MTTYVYVNKKAKITSWNSTSLVDGKKTFYQNQLAKTEQEWGGSYTKINIKEGDNLPTTHNPVGSLTRKSHNSDIKAGKSCHPQLHELSTRQRPRGYDHILDS